MPVSVIRRCCNPSAGPMRSGIPAMIFSSRSRHTRCGRDWSSGVCSSDLIVPAIAALFYLGGSAFHDYRAKETGFMLAESGILTGILTVTGMWVLSEDRPREGGRLHPFKGIGHDVSGHAATAASISGVLSRMYFQVEPDDGRVDRTFKWIGKGFVYAAPVAVSFGPVNEQGHFVYSTILGMAIGFWTSNAVADAHGLYLQAPGSRLKPSGVAPIVGDRAGAGAVVRWEF